MAKKKWKKLLKKAGKAALIGGALYAATKGLKGRQGTPLGIPGGVDAIAAAKLKRNKAIDAGILSAEHDSESDMYKPKRFKMPLPIDQRVQYAGMRKDGGRIGAKHGGSVTGVAKRGFGRALMKGKK